MNFQVNSTHTINNHRRTSRLFNLQDSIEAHFLTHKVEKIYLVPSCVPGTDASQVPSLQHEQQYCDDRIENQTMLITIQTLGWQTEGNRRKCRVLMSERTNAIHIEDTAPEPTLYVRMLAVGKIVLSRSEEVGYSNDSVLGEVSYSIVNGCHEIWDHCTRNKKSLLGPNYFKCNITYTSFTDKQSSLLGIQSLIATPSIEEQPAA